MQVDRAQLLEINHQISQVRETIMYLERQIHLFFVQDELNRKAINSPSHEGRDAD